MLSPAQVVLERCRAFAEGDFPRIYDFYHPESFFRRLYPDRQGYLDYAREVLVRDFAIEECRVLKEETSGDEARVLYYLEVAFQEHRQGSFEYSRLRLYRGGWRFLATQKLERDEYAGEPETIGWEDFDRVEEKIIY